MKITALYYPDDICTMYTLYPILRSRYSSMFDFVTDPEDVFKFKKNRIICIFRFFRRELSDQATRDYLRRLRDQYDRIVYFEDSPDPRKIFLNAIDEVDIYYKKSMLKDRSLYKKAYYSETLYGDFYHSTFGVADAVEAVAKPLTEGQLAKIKLAWNIGIGSYPKDRVRRAICRRVGMSEGRLRLLARCLGHPKNYRYLPRKSGVACPMRFRVIEEPKSLSWQRCYFTELAKTRPDLFVYGKVPLDAYNRELRRSKLTFSPYGLGEVCFRDFEAIINHSLLLKPDMDHIETWPAVYSRNETYIPLKWDGSDFIETVERWASEDSSRITDSAYEVYMSSFLRYSERLETILGQICGKAS